jgi:hypothetical protein
MRRQVTWEVPHASGRHKHLPREERTLLTPEIYSWNPQALARLRSLWNPILL